MWFWVNRSKNKAVVKWKGNFRWFCILKFIKHLHTETHWSPRARLMTLTALSHNKFFLDLSLSLLVMLAVKQRMLEDTSWWLSGKGNLVQKHYHSPSLHILGAQKLETTHPIVILPSQVKSCNVLLLVWSELYEILRQSKPGVHHTTHPPALNSFSFQWKAGSMVGRREKRGQTITHPSWQTSSMWLQCTSGPPPWKTAPGLTVQMHLYASQVVLSRKLPCDWLWSPNKWLWETHTIFHGHTAVLLHWQTHGGNLGMWFLLLS